MVEQGDYPSLVSSGGMLARLVEEFAAGVKDKVEEDEPAPDALSEPIDDAESEKVKQQGENVQGTVPWSVYKLYLRAMGWGQAAICE